MKYAGRCRFSLKHDIYHWWENMGKQRTWSIEPRFYRWNYEETVDEEDDCDEADEEPVDEALNKSSAAIIIIPEIVKLIIQLIKKEAKNRDLS